MKIVIIILTLLFLYNIWGIIFGLNVCFSEPSTTPVSCFNMLPYHLADWNKNIIIFTDEAIKQLIIFIGGIMVKFQS
jgi:hypothetical protein